MWVLMSSNIQRISTLNNEITLQNKAISQIVEMEGIEPSSIRVKHTHLHHVDDLYTPKSTFINLPLKSTEQ